MEKIFLVLMISFFIPALMESAPPAPGVSPKGMPKDGVHKLPDVSHLIQRAAPAPAVAKALGTTTGTISVVVIFVEFFDTKMSTTEITTYTGPAFDGNDSNCYLKKLKDFISEVSYNALTINFTIKLLDGTDAYYLRNSMGFYGSSNESNVTNGELFKDACSAAAVSGSFDALVVIHAGTGEESSGTDDDIWSLFVNWGTLKRGFKEGLTVPAKESGSLSPFGVFCHEFGHQLGLPDLYNTNTGSSNVGKWDLMDYGAWINNGNSPPHPSSWGKIQLGWISAVTVNTATTVNVNNLEGIGVTASAFKVPVLGSSTEYFLIEYRKQTGYDTNLPGQGILIWHIDDTIGSIIANNINNDSTHLRVDLEEADKGNNAGTNNGELTDAFRTTADMFTTPQSDGYTGQSYVTIYDFSGLGNDTMTAKVFIIPATTDLNLKKSFNFPNPVKNQSSSTIRVTFSRPFTTANLKIYTISGELVADRTLTQSNLNTTVSTENNEWVYDYNWDLKNDGGHPVASGLYVHMVVAEITGQKQVKTGKIAIIR